MLRINIVKNTGISFLFYCFLFREHRWCWDVGISQQRQEYFSIKNSREKKEMRSLSLRLFQVSFSWAVMIDDLTDGWREDNPPQCEKVKSRGWSCTLMPGTCSLNGCISSPEGAAALSVISASLCVPDKRSQENDNTLKCLFSRHYCCIFTQLLAECVCVRMWVPTSCQLALSCAMHVR